MFIKPTKKWRSPDGNSGIKFPYTYYTGCASQFVTKEGLDKIRKGIEGKVTKKRNRVNY